ncbi:hypothetical protein HDU98_006373 [Podochytrium sp. JEL0797]|nr:hypothetical protein HDU98_006373 [Podochytrium sp. JEL0797]
MVFTMLPDVHKAFCTEIMSVKTRSELLDSCESDRVGYGGLRHLSSTFEFHQFLGYSTHPDEFDAISYQYARKVDLVGRSVSNQVALATFESTFGYHKYQIPSIDGQDVAVYARRETKTVTSKSRMSKMSLPNLLEASKDMASRSPATPTDRYNEPHTLMLNILVTSDASRQFKCAGDGKISVGFEPTEKQIRLGLQSVVVQFEEGQFGVLPGWGFRSWTARRDPELHPPPKREIKAADLARVKRISGPLWEYLNGRSDMDNPTELDAAGDSLEAMDATTASNAMNSSHTSVPASVVTENATVSGSGSSRTCSNKHGPHEHNDVVDPAMEVDGGDPSGCCGDVRLGDEELKPMLVDAVDEMHKKGEHYKSDGHPDGKEVPEYFNSFGSEAHIQHADQEAKLNVLIAENSAAYHALESLGAQILHVQMKLEKVIAANGLIAGDGNHPVIRFMDSSLYRIHFDSDDADEPILGQKFLRGNFDYLGTLVTLAKATPVLHLKGLLSKLSDLKPKSGPWRDVLMLALIFDIELVGTIEPGNATAMLKNGGVVWFVVDEFRGVIVDRSEEGVRKLSEALVASFLAKVTMPKGLEVLPKSQSVATMLRNVVTFLSSEVKEEREEKGPLSQTQISNKIRVCVVSSATIDPDEAAQSLFELAKYRKMLAKDRKGLPYPVQVEDGLSFDVYRSFKPAECQGQRGRSKSSHLVTETPKTTLWIPMPPDQYVMARFLLSLNFEKLFGFDSTASYGTRSAFYGQEINVAPQLQSGLFWLVLSSMAQCFSLTSPVSEADNADADAAKSLEIATCSLKGCRTRDKARAALLLEPISYYFNITLRNIRSSPFPSIHSIRVNEVNDMLESLGQICATRKNSAFCKAFTPNLGGTCLSFTCKSVKDNFDSFKKHNSKTLSPDFRVVFCDSRHNWLDSTGSVLYPDGSKRNDQPLQVQVKYNNHGIRMQFGGHGGLVTPHNTNPEFKKVGLKLWGLERGEATPSISNHVEAIEFDHETVL